MGGVEKHGVRLSADETLELHVIGAANSMEGALLRSGWAWDELAELLLPVGAKRGSASSAMRLTAPARCNSASA